MNPKVPYFLQENHFARIERNNADLKRIQKLHNILYPKNKKVKNIGGVSVDLDKENFQVLKQQDLQRRHNSKLQKINQENQRMIKALVTIQQGKRSDLNKNVCKPKVYGQTLHQGPKKKKIQEIDYENKLLAKRILSTKPMISNETFKKDEKKYLKLRSHLQKKKLPPVNQNSQYKPRSLTQHNQANMYKLRSQSYMNENALNTNNFYHQYNENSQFQNQNQQASIYEQEENKTEGPDTIKVGEHLKQYQNSKQIQEQLDSNLEQFNSIQKQNTQQQSEKIISMPSIQKQNSQKSIPKINDQPTSFNQKNQSHNQNLPL